MAVCVGCLCVWVWLVRLLCVIVGEVMAVRVGPLYVCMGVAGSAVPVIGGEVWLCVCVCVGGGG